MMKFPIINRFFPSFKWKVAAVIIGGVIVGGGALFMYMLRAHTYLGDDPAACVLQFGHVGNGIGQVEFLVGNLIRHELAQTVRFAQRQFLHARDVYKRQNMPSSAVCWQALLAG